MPEQAFQLHDLAVVDKQVHLRAVVLDIPGKDLRVGGLEHDVLQTQSVGDPGHHVGPPRADVLGNPFRFDHNHGGPGIQKPAGLGNRPARIAGSLGF